MSARYIDRRTPWEIRRARRQNSPASVEAVCIGCGCRDSHACIDTTFGEPCFWIKVDRTLKIGVCSSCEHKIEEYEKRILASRGVAEGAEGAQA